MESGCLYGHMVPDELAGMWLSNYQSNPLAIEREHFVNSGEDDPDGSTLEPIGSRSEVSVSCLCIETHRLHVWVGFLVGLKIM